MKTLYWISVPAQKVTWSFDQVRLNYATTNHHLQPPTYIHHHPPPAKIYPPPPTTTQNTSTTTNHSPNYIQVRCFIRMTTIRMTTRPGRVVAYNEELPSIKSHYPLITWSSDFDFSHTICRLRAKTLKSSPTSGLHFWLTMTTQNLETQIMNEFLREKYRDHEFQWAQNLHIKWYNIFNLADYEIN